MRQGSRKITVDPDDGERPRKVSLRQRPARERAEEATEKEPSAPDPGRSLAEVVGTIVGDQAPGLVKGLHDGRLQGPFLSGRQVLFQLLQAGHAQDDRVPVGALQGETARRHTLMPRRDPVTHPRPAPAKAWAWAYSLHLHSEKVHSQVE